MFNVLSRKLMRVAFFAVLAIAGTMLLADSSSAATRSLSGTHTAGEIKAACDTAPGGVYYGPGPGGSGYGCVGDKGSVSCDSKGKCTGTCPKCANVMPTANGNSPAGGAGTAGNAKGAVRAHSVPSHKVKPVVAVNHVPLKKIATRATAHAR
jgi:hypothetical protein